MRLPVCRANVVALVVPRVMSLVAESTLATVAMARLALEVRWMRTRSARVEACRKPLRSDVTVLAVRAILLTTPRRQTTKVPIERLTVLSLLLV